MIEGSDLDVAGLYGNWQEGMELNLYMFDWITKFVHLWLNNLLMHKYLLWVVKILIWLWLWGIFLPISLKMVVVYYIFPYRYHSRGKFIIICSNKSKHWKKEINTVTEMMLFFGLLLKCLPHRTCFLLQVIYLTQLLLSQSAQVIYLFIVICFCFLVKLEFTPKSKFLFTWNLILLLLQNPNVLICTPNFTIGSSRSCNFVLKYQTISANLCKIKHT